MKSIRKIVHFPKLLLWDGASGLESLMQAGNAGIPRMYFGSVGNCIRDTDQIIYDKDKDDGSVAEVFSYDLGEKKSTFLFEDDSNVTLRFLGETENEFICERVAGEEQSVCKISKDSYYGGDIDDAVKLMDGN